MICPTCGKAQLTERPHLHRRTDKAPTTVPPRHPAFTHNSPANVAACPSCSPVPTPMTEPTVTPLTGEEAVEHALLYTFQLSGKDYRKMQAALSEVEFLRVLEQDGYTVSLLDAARTDSLDVKRLAAAIEVGMRGGYVAEIPTDLIAQRVLAIIEGKP